MWYIIGVIIVVAVLFLLVKNGVAANFLTYYKRAIRSGESEQDALRGAMNHFRYRKPFDQLTDDDIECVLSEMMKSEDPAKATSILFQHCESKSDVSILKKQWIKSQQGQ